MVRFSIIIPTAFDKCETLLKPCLESIVQQTDFGHESNLAEIIVVSNGCTDNTDAYLRSFASLYSSVTIRQESFPNAVGYPKAINAGIESAEGEFVVLLNNDTVLLPQPRSKWLELLHAPFSDPKVAVTGPWKVRNSQVERDFLIFFCCMIRRSVIDEIGPLDEIFGAGHSEDVDFCFRAQDAGYKIVQVPVEEKLPYDGMRAHGNYPIFHKGNQTFQDHPDDALIQRNQAIIRELYGVNIEKALKVDGMMSPSELCWLAHRARSAQVVIECGSWAGRSTRALADNLPPGGVLYAIDTWAGSAAEKDTGMRVAREMDGDHVFIAFCRNLWDLIAAGKVIPVRAHGRHAAKLLTEMGIQADLLFIDAGHLYEEVKEDIQNFLPLLNPNGIISGHDYGWNNQFNGEVWTGVKQAVDESFVDPVCADDTTIWSARPPHKRHTDAVQAPKIFDCFIFNNELDILERRLTELYDTVDRFIIVEGNKTHSRKDKELVFHNNLPRFERFLNKITYLVVEDWPVLGPGAQETDWSWAYERFQRDAIMRGLTSCKDNDIIVISDCDEIPNPFAIREYRTEDGIKAFDMTLYCYDEQTVAVDPWREAKILPYGLLKTITPCGARYTKGPLIPNGGKHLSYFGGVDAIAEKISNTAHRELDMPRFTSRGHIADCIWNGTDLFERPDIKFKKVCQCDGTIHQRHDGPIGHAGQRGTVGIPDV